MKYYPQREHMSLQSLPSDTSSDSSLKRHESCSVISAARPGYVPAWNKPPGTRRQKPDLSPICPLEAQRRSSWHVWVHISTYLVSFVFIAVTLTSDQNSAPERMQKKHRCWWKNEGRTLSSCGFFPPKSVKMDQVHASESGLLWHMF